MRQERIHGYELTSCRLSLRRRFYAPEVFERLLCSLEAQLMLIKILLGEEIPRTCLRSLCLRLLSWMRLANSTASSWDVILLGSSDWASREETETRCPVDSQE